MTAPSLNSAIYRGRVVHHRLRPKRHQLAYPYAMAFIDLDELSELAQHSRWFAVDRWAPLRFDPRDHLGGGDTDLKTRVIIKAQDLGADRPINRVCYLGQLRHFGRYFSPVNFFFCYQDAQLNYVLAEVSNTPWDERHVYLIDMAVHEPISDKAFHVSPFMAMAQRYRWHIQPPDKRVSIGIASQGAAGEDEGKPMFAAGLNMTRQAWTAAALRRHLWRFPLMAWQIKLAIHWQALRLWLKRIPVVAHPRSKARKGAL